MDIEKILKSMMPRPVRPKYMKKIYAEEEQNGIKIQVGKVKFRRHQVVVHSSYKHPLVLCYVTNKPRALRCYEESKVRLFKEKDLEVMTIAEGGIPMMVTVEPKLTKQENVIKFGEA